MIENNRISFDLGEGPTSVHYDFETKAYSLKVFGTDDLVVVNDQVGQAAMVHALVDLDNDDLVKLVIEILEKTR